MYTRVAKDGAKAPNTQERMERRAQRSLRIPRELSKLLLDLLAALVADDEPQRLLELYNTWKPILEQGARVNEEHDGNETIPDEDPPSFHEEAP